MKVSAWRNGGNQYGIRVGVKNRREYFDTSWKEIVVEIEDVEYAFALTNGFWRSCPEFRDRGRPIIREWLSRRGALQWPYRQPHKFMLTPKSGASFTLTDLPADRS